MSQWQERQENQMNANNSSSDNTEPSNAVDKGMLFYKVGFAYKCHCGWWCY
jgi:hypothetical protein